MPEHDRKYDQGKAPVSQGVFEYFPRALKAIAAVSDYGIKKYKVWGSWKDVVNGVKRYENAEARHELDQFIDGRLDPESKLLHKAHLAWNSLAVLELELIREEEEQKRRAEQDQPRNQYDPTPCPPTPGTTPYRTLAYTSDWEPILSRTKNTNGGK